MTPYLVYPPPDVVWLWAPCATSPSFSPSVRLAPRLHTIPLPTLSPRWDASSSYLPSSAAANPGDITMQRGPRRAVDPPSINSLIAFSPAPGARHPLNWDVAKDPANALAAHPLYPSSSYAYLHPAVRVNASPQARALSNLTLVLPNLPPSTHVTVLPTHPDGFASVADVLVALHRRLREPIPQHELHHVLGGDERARLRRSTRERAGGHGRLGPRRKIDFLAKRRRFLGIRPAIAEELPPGACLGEVFVVEMGFVEG